MAPARASGGVLDASRLLASPTPGLQWKRPGPLHLGESGQARGGRPEPADCALGSLASAQIALLYTPIPLGSEACRC